MCVIRHCIFNYDITIRIVFGIRKKMDVYETVLYAHSDQIRKEKINDFVRRIQKIHAHVTHVFT